MKNDVNSRVQAVDPNEVNNEIMAMRRYIDRTMGLAAASHYHLAFEEIRSLGVLAKETPFDALILAFYYGRAKGYRAAKKEARKA